MEPAFVETFRGNCITDHLVIRITKYGDLTHGLRGAPRGKIEMHGSPRKLCGLGVSNEHRNRNQRAESPKISGGRTSAASDSAGPASANRSFVWRRSAGDERPAASPPHVVRTIVLCCSMPAAGSLADRAVNVHRCSAATAVADVSDGAAAASSTSGCIRCGGESRTGGRK